MDAIKNNFKDLFFDKEKRDGKRITKSQAATAIGITRTTFDKWFSDNVNRYDENVLRGICDYFNVPLSELLEYTPEDTSN